MHRLLLVLLFLPCHLMAMDASLSAFVGSDELSLGASQTGGNTIAGAQLSLDHRNGGFVQLRANTSRKSPVPDRTRGVHLGAGWFREVQQGKAIELRFDVHRPSGGFPVTWDYETVGATWHLSRQWAVSVTASDDLHGRGFASGTIESRARFDLGEPSYLMFGGSMTSLGGSSELLAHLHTGIGISRGRFDARVIVSHTNESTRTFMGADDRTVVQATVTARLY